ncbi:hypothetical protein LSAT2_023848 [Lamellibrachia satsuma]|nr:hypothetical protein LSAT2_023848 [Lamellibrachia satsuma]
MSGEWANGLCSCFNDPMLCIITYIIPCYTAGNNAAAVGKNCILWGCLSVLAPCFLAIVRKDMREQKSIGGSFINDILMSWCCGLCVIVQMAQVVVNANGYLWRKSEAARRRRALTESKTGHRTHFADNETPAPGCRNTVGPKRGASKKHTLVPRVLRNRHCPDFT